MEDHPYAPDTLVEEREEVMVPPSGGNPITRKAHFLKPIFTKDHLHLPPPPTSLLSSKPTSKNFQKCALQTYKGYPSEKWKFWVQRLKPKYQEIWKKIGIYEAILASTHTIPKDKKLIICVAERWCADTNSFIFPWGEVTITLEDVIHLGCYSVLGASFLTPLDDEAINICNCLNNVQKKIRLGYRSVGLSVWMDSFMCSGNDLEHEAFLALWLSRFVLVRPQNYIAKQAFHVAIHLSRGNKVALAPVVLACIYRDMRLLHNSVAESIKLGSMVGLRFLSCHYDLVQMWVWERFAELRPVPNVIGRGEPRSARWNGVTKLKVNNLTTALDSAGLSFLWRPYAMISSNSMLSNLYKDNEQWVVVDSDAIESFARCLRASELVGLGCTEQYLPHRVAMQFGLDQDLPSHVFRSNESPDTAWSSYNRPIRGVKLYIPPRLDESDVSSRYVAWWRGLVVVNEELVTNSIQNEKNSPLVSCGHKRDAKSLATPGSLSGCHEERPENIAAEDGLTSAQLMSRSGKTDSSGKKNDLDNDPILNSYHNVEDNLTIAQLLNRSRKRDSSDKARDDDDDELVLSIVTPGLVSICNENRKELHCTSEPVELSAQNMSSPDKCEKSKSSTEKQTEPKEDSAVSRNLKFINEPEETNVYSMSLSDKHKKSKSSTDGKRQTEPEADAVVSPEDNIINVEEESCDYEETTSELRPLGLKARIWRLETIVSMIKAAELTSSSGGNLEK